MLDETENILLCHVWSADTKIRLGIRVQSPDSPCLSLWIFTNCKTLIRLHRCTCWSKCLMSPHGIRPFPCDKVHATIFLHSFTPTQIVVISMNMLGYWQYQNYFPPTWTGTHKINSSRAKTETNRIIYLQTAHL